MAPGRYTFTVFTPTYDRAHTLHRVYESLKAQTFRDFEWLIVDDGSTDGTDTLVREWQRESDFPIRYIWQENTGKHVAVNKGVLEALGELFLLIDSDNACVPISLERFKFHWDSIPEGQKKQFSAVTSLTQDPNGNLIGTRFPFDPTDSDSLEIRYKHKVKGEKWGFHRTDVMRRYPYPIIDGENAMPESLVWIRIAQNYKTRYVNEVLEVYYTSPDSLTTNSRKIRSSSPTGNRQYYIEFINLEYPIPRMVLLRKYVNYVRFSFHAGINIFSQVREIPSTFYWLAALPIGYFTFLRDKRFVPR